MARSTVRRRLATVLFLDIVGSTAVATSLGDTRWRELLTRFRRVVRAELKRYGGREQDTAGDGFFATFTEPAPALDAAAAIVNAVQALGIDVRASVHTGECELIDGKLAGIAVHIASRVMALAGPAEVLVTGTVRDLVAGSGASFEDRGAHELKGIEGAWHVHGLLGIETRLPPPLPPGVAAERLALVTPSTLRRRRGLLVAGSCAGVAAAILIPLLTVGGGAARAAPISLVRLDAKTGRVETVVHDGPVGCPCGPNLWAVDGTLWQRTGESGEALAARSISSGEQGRRLPLPRGSVGFAFGSGSIWVLRSTLVFVGPNSGTAVHVLDRVDELSGRTVASIRIPGETQEGAVATGNGAVWVLEADGMLDRIDPSTNRVAARYATGARETTILVPLGRYEWVCECSLHEILRFDPQTGEAKTFRFAEQPWHLVGVDSAHGRTLWLFDQANATLTQIDVRTGSVGQPHGLGGKPSQAVLAAGSIWVAAGPVVDRVSLSSGERSTIQMPRGVYAGGIATDPATGAIWVDNSLRPSSVS